MKRKSKNNIIIATVATTTLLSSCGIANTVSNLNSDISNYSTDYEGKCGDCREIFDETDQYCKYCGTKRGEGAFEP